MSLFTDASIEAAARRLATPGLLTSNEEMALLHDLRVALDAAIAALDETELIEKAAAAAVSRRYGHNALVFEEDRAQARAVLVAIGLLPEETRP